MAESYRMYSCFVFLCWRLVVCACVCVFACRMTLALCFGYMCVSACVENIHREGARQRESDRDPWPQVIEHNPIRRRGVIRPHLRREHVVETFVCQRVFDCWIPHINHSARRGVAEYRNLLTLLLGCDVEYWFRLLLAASTRACARGTR